MPVSYTHLYAGLLMLLTTAIAGAYFASNLAVTWIFLEATTLCSAGIVYHRRTAQALEAAWKYVFVCSTGIAMAYLGILLLAAATDCESLDYATVAAAAPGGSALYLKTAFLLILCGYSCKAELFPLYKMCIRDRYMVMPSSEPPRARILRRKSPAIFLLKRSPLSRKASKASLSSTSAHV